MTDPIETKEKIISQRRSETSFLADTNFLFEGEFYIIQRVVTDPGVPKNVKRPKSSPKLSAVGLNFTMEMTWGRLFLLSLSIERPKNTFPAQVVPPLVIEPMHLATWLQQHSIGTFFWDTL